MLLTLDDNNNVVPTEQFLVIGALRKLYDKYNEDHELAIAYLSCLFYMYHFDSHLLWENRDDEVARLVAVRKFIHRGKDVKICKVMGSAMKVYKSLYNKESVSMYLTMRDNIKKLREYMDVGVLIVPEDYVAGEGPAPVVIDSKELVLLNKNIPEQWKILDTFERDLQAYTKSKVDIYGGGQLGAYE